jgi:uncharacterized protein with HEPN domain
MKNLGHARQELRHGYDRINFEILWNTVAMRTPPLAADARAALRRLES